MTVARRLTKGEEEAIRDARLALCEGFLEVYVTLKECGLDEEFDMSRLAHEVQETTERMQKYA